MRKGNNRKIWENKLFACGSLQFCKTTICGQNKISMKQTSQVRLCWKIIWKWVKFLLELKTIWEGSGVDVCAKEILSKNLVSGKAARQGVSVESSCERIASLKSFFLICSFLTFCSHSGWKTTKETLAEDPGFKFSHKNENWHKNEKRQRITLPGCHVHAKTPLCQFWCPIVRTMAPQCARECSLRKRAPWSESNLLGLCNVYRRWLPEWKFDL